MKNIIKHTILNGLVAVSVLGAASSCADSWDEHFTNGPEGISSVGESSEQTIMDVLDAKTPNFAKVVRAAGYEKEFASENIYTVWAPEITSEQADEYISQIETRGAKRVITQLIKSHMTRFNHSLSTTASVISLVNNKKISFGTQDDPTFGATKILEPNIPCKNGVVHVIDQINEFVPNLYELIELRQEDAPYSQYRNTLYRYLARRDSFILDDNRSVYHGYDENGNRNYVDSVTERWNLALQRADAYIYEEDSDYTVIIPSVDAYLKRFNQAVKLLNYNRESVNSGDLKTQSMSSADSLVYENANRFAMRNLYFNNRMQKSPNDSLTSTLYRNGDWEYSVYYNPFSGTPRADRPDMPYGIFAPGKYVEKVQCSNGVAYLVDEYPTPITEQFFTRIKIQPDTWTMYHSDDTKINYATKDHHTINTRSYTLQLPPYKIVPDVADDGKTNKDEDGNFILDTLNIEEAEAMAKTQLKFLHCEPKAANNNPIYTFYLSNTLSGTYEIQLVLAPPYLSNIASKLDFFPSTKCRFEAFVLEQNGEEFKTDAGKFTKDTKAVKLTPDAAHITEDGKYVEYNPLDADGVLQFSDTISLGEYTFNYCYRGSNDTRGALLELKPGGVKATVFNGKTYSKHLNILAIILKPKWDENAMATPGEATQSKRR